MPRFALVALAILLALSASEATAQALRASDLVSWRVRADRAAPGAEARIVFDAEIAEGWRLYALDSPVGRPLSVSLDALPAGFGVGPLRQSAPLTGFDEGFEVDYPYFSASARIAQTVTVGAAVPAGRHLVSGRVAFTVCDDSVCLAPSRIPFRVPIVVTAR